MDTLLDSYSSEGDDEPPSSCSESEPPQRTPASNRFRLFGAVSDTDWNDWKWQFRNRITSVEQLAKYAPLSIKRYAEIRRGNPNLSASNYSLLSFTYGLKQPPKTRLPGRLSLHRGINRHELPASRTRLKIKRIRSFPGWYTDIRTGCSWCSQISSDAVPSLYTQT
jgi:hypothetical protein